MPEQEQVGPLPGGDRAAVAQAENGGRVDRGGGNGLGRGQPAEADGEGEGKRHGVGGRGAGVAVGRERHGTALRDKEAGPGIAAVNMEAGAGQNNPHGARLGEGDEVGLGRRLQMVHAARAEADGLGDHAERSKLVGVDAERVMLGGFFKKPHTGLERPGAVLAKGVDGDVGKFLRDARQHFLHHHPGVFVQFALERVAEQRRRHDGAGPLMAGAHDGPEHLQFLLGLQAIAAFDLHRCGAFGEHRRQTLLEVGGELFLGGFAHGTDGGVDAAAGLENFEIRDTPEPLLPFIEPVTGPTGVGMAIHKARHQHPALRVDDLRVGRGFHLDSHRGDLAVGHEHFADGNEPQVTQFLAAAWTSARRQGQDAGVANKEAHRWAKPVRKERNR